MLYSKVIQPMSVSGQVRLEHAHTHNSAVDATGVRKRVHSASLTRHATKTYNTTDPDIVETRNA